MCAAIIGAGTAVWNLTFQAITTVSFSEEDLGKVSQFVQFFESIGFLLPSIALAVIGSIKLSVGAPDEVDNDNAGGNQLAIRYTAIVLAIASLFFHLLSSGQLVRAVANRHAEELTTEKNGMRAIGSTLKEFFTTSIVANDRHQCFQYLPVDSIW